MPHLSVLIPIYNEADNLIPLINEIRAALDDVIDYELIYVDDGSTDNSWQILKSIDFDKLRVIHHQRSYGQSVAVVTGAKAACSEWIVTLDGDGQNDPADIPHLLAARTDNPQAKMIIGQRRVRQDNWFKRKASYIANKVRRFLLHDDTLDTGCGLKLFTRSAFLELPHFNHIHRFLPALFLRNGYKVISLKVNHRPRCKGKSKYGIFDRLGVGIVDILGVMWLQRRSCKAEIIEEIK
ncbi:glycosyltransferase family 2 protein [Candidatus Halobeggiatoa sp. HSG11]|nr:glycosyltransferase family 2 protein [Candidatus Halobeggiatoa sp. HSG11]